MNELIDWSAVECLNQKPAHRIDNALKQVRRVLQPSRRTLAASLWQLHSMLLLSPKAAEGSLNLCYILARGPAAACLPGPAARRQATSV